MVYFAATPQLSTDFIYRYSNQPQLINKVLSAISKIGTEDDRIILMAPKAQENLKTPTGLLVHYKPKDNWGPANRTLIYAEDPQRWPIIKKAIAPHYQHLKVFKFLSSDKRKQELEQLLFWLKDTFGVKPENACSYRTKAQLKQLKSEFLNLIPPAKRRPSK
jgi:hypothetical protein